MFVKLGISNIILLTLLFQCFRRVKSQDEAPEVVTSLGTIRGVRADNGNYSMYMGIPFAMVNTSNIFGDSLAFPSFNGIFEANDDSVACPQIEEFNDTIIGSLDCLNLNVYVPDSASPQNPLAVMLYIFGGGFSLGFPSRFILGPKFLVRHDVIFVTINYRLGPYGFFCLNTPEIPGNQGLRDQVRGMRWVKEHIAAFGGDPNRITIFGNSAGGISVDYHVLSEVETLYQRAIIQSGTAISNGATEADENLPLRIADSAGYSTNDVNEALAYLATLDVNTVIQATSDSGVTLSPCIEKEIDGVERIISNYAVNLNAPKSADLQVMIGSNDDEMLLLTAALPPETFPFLSDSFRSFLQNSFNFDEETLVAAERMLRNFYIGDEDFTIDIMFELGDFFSDMYFIYPTERTIRQYLDSGAEVYYYMFAYSGQRNFNKVRNNVDVRGAYHADELGYLFDMQLVTDEPTPEDQLIIDRMTLLWTNFAKYGTHLNYKGSYPPKTVSLPSGLWALVLCQQDPTPETTALVPVKWEPITRGSVYNYINITTEINTSRRPFHSRMAFWDLFYEAYGEYERTYGYRSSGFQISAFPIYLVLGISFILKHFLV